MFSVDRFLIEFDFNEAVRVGADDEVDFSPVDHDDLLYIVDQVGQLGSVQTLKTTVLLCGSEITVKDLLLVEPFRTEKLFFTGLVGVLVDEVGHHVVFLLLFR